MANKIATQSDAYSIGGTYPSGYSAKKCCTNAMAISCGCANPGYASKRLVPENKLEAAGISVTYELNTMDLTSIWRVELVFTDCNGDSQELIWTSDITSTSKFLLSVTYTGDKTIDELYFPFQANAAVRMTEYSTESVASVDWTKNVYGNSITFTASVNVADAGGGIIR